MDRGGQTRREHGDVPGGVDVAHCHGRHRLLAREVQQEQLTSTTSENRFDLVEGDELVPEVGEARIPDIVAGEQGEHRGDVRT